MVINIEQFRCRNSPRSCLDIARTQNTPLPNQYYRIYYQSTCNKNFSDYFFVYCDFTSQPGYAWTLIESFSLNYENKLDKGFTEDHWAYPYSPRNNWMYYRMDRGLMLSIMIRDQSLSGRPLWRATCNFNTLPRLFPPLPRDIIYSSFSSLDLLNFKYGRCLTLDYVDIRGNTKISMPYYVYASSRSHLHIESDPTRECGNRIPNSNYNDYYFGDYTGYHAGFSCSKSGNSTTNWWIGGKIG